MSKVLVTFSSAEDPTISEVIERFSLDESDIDRDFGVVELDPDEHLFTALIEAPAAARIHGVDSEVGVHSNPPMRPFNFGRSRG
jgi:hypothetical protein